MLQLGHGDEAVETLQGNMVLSPNILSFNWATAMKPWRRALHRLKVLAGCAVLQLGHGDEAVETPMRLTINQTIHLVLQLGHGDEAVETGWAGTCSSPCSFLRLQLGHGDEAVETSLAQQLGPLGHLLQLGHGDEAVETVSPSLLST